MLRTFAASEAAYVAPRPSPAARKIADMAKDDIEKQRRTSKAALSVLAQRAKENKQGAILIEESIRRRAVQRYVPKDKAANKSRKVPLARPAWLPPYDPSKYRFTVNPKLCINNGSQPVYFLVLVQSAVKNFERRTLIRDTWGSECGSKGSAATALCRLGFVLGTSSDPVLERKVRDESSRYGDLVRSDFADSYYNLSLSTVTALRWAHQHCTDYRYLVKADDDAFVNLAALRDYLAARPTHRRTAIYGYLMKGFRPNRNKGSKWFTSPELFAKARLPDFVSGFAYVVTRDAVKPLYAAAQVTAMFPFEDVYVTGMCRERARGQEAVVLEGVAKFYNHRKSKAATPCSYAGVLAQHELTAAETTRLWRDLKSGKCS
ncbi:hypothetical protein V5799_004743 [Amblyomma americanum]|uniref:Hexosyltransferase n=1 Tax=Amblyomma americanum TaxID=6943 RepID=A0AAQ4D590_AMBAM